MSTLSPKCVFALLAVVALAGCGSLSRKPVPAAPVDPVAQAIEAHANSVRHAWTGYSGLAAQNGGLSEQAPPATFPIESLPESLRVPVEVDWHGELEPAAQALAEYIGWNFAVVGAKPSQPILVLLSSTADPVGVLLRSLGQQAGQRANIIVRAPTKAIEVVYR